MRWCLFALLVGCVADEPPPDVVVIDNMAVLDVVITPNGLTLYADSQLADPECTPRFPDVGGVVQVDDVWSPCHPSLFGCIERITYAGTTYESPTNEAPMVIASPPSGPTLVIEGCGATATVALPLVTLPSPPTVHGAIVYDTTNRVVDIGWDNDPRAASHLVTLGSWLWSEVHHVDSGDERFTTPYQGSLVTIVQALLAGHEQITPLGLVRLWPASEPTTYQLQAAPRL